MIGTKFAKPLEPNTLTRTVTKTVTREVAEQEAVLDENGMVIDYKPVTKTVTEEVPEQETYDNQAPNTYTKYREAAQWCNANGARMVECPPDKEYPNGYYEVRAIPAPSLEELREAKLVELRTEFKIIRDTAWVMSSLGFKADANDTANTDVEGLIKRMTALGEMETTFCDFDNIERNVTLEGLHTLQLEIIMNGQYLYKQKWDIRDAIKATKTKDGLDAIEIKFTMMDFSA